MLSLSKFCNDVTGTQTKQHLAPLPPMLRSFFRSFFRSDWLLVPLSLLLGALLVLGGILGYYLTGTRYQDQHSLTWPGQPLAIQAGEITTSEEGITVNRLDARDRGAIRLAGTIPDTSRFDRLRLETTGLAPDTRLGLVWRDFSRPGGGRVFWLPKPEQGTIDLALADQSWWRNGIADLTLLIQGPATLPFTIQSIKLQATPATVRQLLSQLWQEWTLFTGWTQRSINFLPAGKRHGLISPVLTVAIGVLVAGLIYLAVRWRIGGPWHLVPFVAIIITGWLILDVRWQWEIAQQLELTRQKYAGKDTREKRLASEDRELFLLAEQFKKVMPPGPNSLWIILPSSISKTEYLSLHLSYYLIPLEFSHFELSQSLASSYPSGAYVFVWTNHFTIHWDGKTQSLVQSEIKVAAEKVIANSNGILYRIL